MYVQYLCKVGIRECALLPGVQLIVDYHTFYVHHGRVMFKDSLFHKLRL